MGVDLESSRDKQKSESAVSDCRLLTSVRSCHVYLEVRLFRLFLGLIALTIGFPQPFMSRSLF